MVLTRGRKITIFLGQIPLEFKMERSSSEKSSGLRQLNPLTGNPIKLQRIDSITGDIVAQVVSGKEVSKNQFIALSDEELEGAFAEKESDIRIIRVEDVADIPVMCIKSHYWLNPQNQAFFDIVAGQLIAKNKQLRFNLVEGRQAHEAVLRIENGQPTLTVLYFPSEIKAPPAVKINSLNPQFALKVDSLLEKMSSVQITPAENQRDEIIDSLIAKKLSGEKIEYKSVSKINSAQKTAEQLLEASL